MTRRFAHFVLLLLLLASEVRARGGDLKVPDVPDGKIDTVVIVPASNVTCAAVSDVANVLAVGHKLGTEPHLTLFALDGQGQPAMTAPVLVSLPRLPPPVRRNYPLGLAFHPKQPLLYVWQDVEAEKPAAPPDVVTKEFNHLLIYNVARLPPPLVQGLARGPDFATNNHAGTVALNLTADRLYLPNLFGQPGKPDDYSAIGYYRLNAEGMPVNADMKPAPINLAGRTPNITWALSSFPTGCGFVPLEKDVLITTGYTGPVTWNEHNQRAPFNTLIVHTFTSYYCDRVAGHHKLPVLYDGCLGTPYLSRIEHVDGYLTLAPQHAIIERATLRSAPVVLSKRNQIAFGGDSRVYVVDLDDKGYLTAKRKQMVVNNPGIEALTYSAKFDRLYVPAEKMK